MPAIQALPAQPSTVSQTGGYVNPWLAIWLRPRAAMRSAIAMRAPLETWLLAALTGISATFAWAAWGELGDGLGSAEILALAVFAGPPLGMAALLAGGVLLRTGGQLLGGRASAGRVRAALAWAAAPLVAGLPIWFTQAILLPAATFGAAPGMQRGALSAQSLLALLLGAAHLALWGWSAALSVVGLAEAHLFSLTRAAASWLLAALVVVMALATLFGGAALVIALRGG